MLPAVNKIFSPADHMIPENVERETTRDKPMRITLWLLMQLQSQALQNFRTSHEENAGERNREKQTKNKREKALQGRLNTAET